MRRAGDGGAPLASKGVRLTAGTASTAFVLGTQGQKVRLVVATDSTVAPGHAPETGLGGLAGKGGPSWLLVALAALAAGSLGGAVYLVSGGARRG